jgi:hypothetical protein
MSQQYQANPETGIETAAILIWIKLHTSFLLYAYSPRASALIVLNAPDSPDV